MKDRLKAQEHLDDVLINFIYINIDFFAAPFRDQVSIDAFKAWLSANEGLQDLSDDMNQALDSHKRISYMEMLAKYRIAITNLFEENSARALKYFLQDYPKITSLLKKAIIKENKKLEKSVFNQWYQSQATIEQCRGREVREQLIPALTKIQKKIDAYDQATEQYLAHLKTAIIDEIKAINIKLLEELHESIKNNIKKTSTNLNEQYSGLQKKIFEFLKEIIEFTVTPIGMVEILSVIYELNNKDLIDIITPYFANSPTLLGALNKYAVIQECKNVLNSDANMDVVSKQEILTLYNNKLQDKKDILTQRRDSHLMTFAKGLGVVAASILGLGVGGYFAYIHLFGSKATHGNLFINEIEEINNQAELKKIKQN